MYLGERPEGVSIDEFLSSIFDSVKSSFPEENLQVDEFSQRLQISKNLSLVLYEPTNGDTLFLSKRFIYNGQEVDFCYFKDSIVLKINGSDLVEVEPSMGKITFTTSKNSVPFLMETQVLEDFEVISGTPAGVKCQATLNPHFLNLYFSGPECLTRYFSENRFVIPVNVDSS